MHKKNLEAAENVLAQEKDSLKLSFAKVISYTDLTFTDLSAALKKRSAGQEEGQVDQGVAGGNRATQVCREQSAALREGPHRSEPEAPGFLGAAGEDPRRASEAER